MAEQTRIYERYRQPVQLQRVYVAPEQQADARKLVKKVLGESRPIL